jgi:hypothetical protein
MKTLCHKCHWRARLKLPPSHVRLAGRLCVRPVLDFTQPFTGVPNKASEPAAPHHPVKFQGGAMLLDALSDSASCAARASPLRRIGANIRKSRFVICCLFTPCVALQTIEAANFTLSQRLCPFAALSRV